MVSTHIAKIRSAVLHLADAQERNTTDAANICAKISVCGDEDRWLQLQLGMLNFAYPHQQNPADFLMDRGVTPLAGLTVITFEPNLYATFTCDPCSVEEFFRFVDELLIAVHMLPRQGYSVDVGPEYLPHGQNNAAQRDWYRAMPSRWPRGGPHQVAANGGHDSQTAWREPVLQTDRWELASAEERNRRSHGNFSIPPLEVRAALELGDLALLLFQMLDADWLGELEMAEERMWVLVTEIHSTGRFLGRLVDQPDWVDSRAHYLTLGSEVPFQIEHVAEIRRWEQLDIDDFLANTLHREWE